MSVLKKALAAGMVGVLLLGIFGCATTGKVKVEHMVFIKFKPDATPEQIDACTEALLTLANEIPGIVEMAAGVNSSTEGMDKGHNYGLLVRFSSAAARDAYLTHPNHLSVVSEYAMPILEDLTVVDIEH